MNRELWYDNLNTNPNIYRNLVYAKGDTTDHWEKCGLFNKC